MPSRTEVTSALGHVTLCHLQELAKRLKSDVIGTGAAISVDGVTLKTVVVTTMVLHSTFRAW